MTRFDPGMGPGSALGDNIRIAQEFQAHKTRFEPVLNQLTYREADAAQHLVTTLA